MGLKIYLSIPAKQTEAFLCFGVALSGSVMLRTGMRKGEMQGLKYSDIDKKQNVIHVRRTLKYIEGKGYFEDTPKTRTSTRDIPLTAAITEHIEAQRKYWDFKVVRMDQYLFCNENGDPISRERIQGEIDRIIKRIKSDGYDFPRITSHGRVIIGTS